MGNRAISMNVKLEFIIKIGYFVCEAEHVIEETVIITKFRIYLINVSLKGRVIPHLISTRTSL